MKKRVHHPPPVPLDVQHLQLLHLATAHAHQAAAADGGGGSTGSLIAGSGSRLCSPEMGTLLSTMLTTARVAWLKNDQVSEGGYVHTSMWGFLKGWL